MELVERIKGFSIYRSSDGYIVQNEGMEDFAHTHLEGLPQARKVVKLSMAKKVPLDLPQYLLISLKRVNDDDLYIEKITQVLANKKKKFYFNSNKGVRRK